MRLSICPVESCLVNATGPQATRLSVSITVAVFWLLAAITLASGLGVALSRSIVYSAFALMGTLLGVAALFVLLGADFLGVVQLLVYVGGILVLTLFAVMLTHRISDVNVSNRAVGRLPGAVLAGAALFWMLSAARRATWVVRDPQAPAPTTYGIGNAFLTQYILPFEIASVVLLAALIGAIVVSRKEVKG
jgi:NAD(P)H-quinone oxidoreductase subunit 6